MALKKGEWQPWVFLFQDNLNAKNEVNPSLRTKKYKETKIQFKALNIQLALLRLALLLNQYHFV